MFRRPSRNHSPAFNAKVALAAVEGERKLTELVQQFDIHPNHRRRSGRSRFSAGRMKERRS
jgi:transposase-like protein